MASAVGSKTSKASGDRRYVSVPRVKRAEDESSVRIEKYARVLARRPRATKTASSTALQVTDRSSVAQNSGQTAAPPCGHLDASRVYPGDMREGQMVRRISELGNFVRGLSALARFGDLSRARLSLLRVQLCGEYGECDWIARPADRWDADLPPIVGKRNASQQALQDAIKVRALLFRVLPQLHKAELRAYRYSPQESLELIVSGMVSREVKAPASVRSLAMRAKLFGLSFWLDEGVLENLQPEESVVDL